MPIAAAARVGIGDVLRATGRSAEAVLYYQAAIQRTESTRSQLQSQEFRESFFEGGLVAYASMIDALLSIANFDGAFNYSERARSRSFLDILGNKVQLARSGTLMEQERALQARISVLRAMREGDGTDSDQAPQLRKELDEAQKDYNDYLAKLRKENKEQASLMNVEPLTVTQVQERLDPGVTMLEYFVTSNSVYLWVVEKDRIQIVSTSIPRTELVTKVTSLRDTIYQLGEKDIFNGLSQELYKLLIQPALPHIRGKELVIVPHDVLHYLPFQALFGSDGRYLIEKYPIYYQSLQKFLLFCSSWCSVYLCQGKQQR
jgi:tetratricopeptide (TPR) repeat protein